MERSRNVFKLCEKGGFSVDEDVRNDHERGCG